MECSKINWGCSINDFLKILLQEVFIVNLIYILIMELFYYNVLYFDIITDYDHGRNTIIVLQLMLILNILSKNTLCETNLFLL